jgi:hypothetical protein
VATHLVQAGVRRLHITESPNDVADRVHVGALAQQKDHPARFSRIERDGDVQRCTRIEAGAEAPGERVAAKGCRLREGTVPAKE